MAVVRKGDEAIAAYLDATSMVYIPYADGIPSVDLEVPRLEVARYDEGRPPARVYRLGKGTVRPPAEEVGARSPFRSRTALRRGPTRTRTRTPTRTRARARARASSQQRGLRGLGSSTAEPASRLRAQRGQRGQRSRQVAARRVRRVPRSGPRR